MIQKIKISFPFSLLCLLMLFYSLPGHAQTDYTEKYDSRKFLEEGIALYESEKYTEAITLFDKISKTDPNYLEAQYEKAMTLYHSDKNDELKKLLDSLYESGEMKNFPDLFGVFGIYYSEKKEFEASEKMFKEGEKYAPESNLILFNLGLMYIRSEQPQNAVDCLKKLLQVNPNNVSAYYFLGLLAFEDGRIVEGSLCFLAYLAISPYGNYAGDAIIKLNTKMGTLYSDNHKLTFSQKGDDFSELELILKNELPLSAKYKVKSTIDDNYTRQIQAILEYAKTHDVKDGYFENIFIPWMADIENKNMTENFMYYTLSVLEEKIGKPLTSQKKNVEGFVSNHMETNFWELFGKRNLMHFGKNEDVVIYIKNGLPNSVGKVVNGKYEGKHRFVNSWGGTLSEVSYTSDVLDGPAVYYHKNGNKSDEIIYTKGLKNGPFKSYYLNGNLMTEGVYNNDKLEGSFTSHYPNGGVFCKINFIQDLKNGSSICYYPNGSKKNEFTYTKGMANGAGIHYNEIEDETSHFLFSNNLYEGKGSTYYAKGKLIAEGDYKGGELIGNFKEFYENNSLKYEYDFSGNELIKTKNYDANQALKTEIYLSKGDLTSKVYYDESGKKYYEEKFKKGIFDAAYQYKNGEDTPTEINLKNKFQVRNLQNILIVQGQYDKGKMVGDWEYYFPNGDPKVKLKYVNDEATGMRYEYEQNGDISSIQNLVEGKTNGIYETYELNKPYLKMHFTDDEANGPYSYYYDNGKISHEGYMVGGEKSFKQYLYAYDGRLTQINEYIDDFLIAKKTFKKDGQIDAEFQYAGKNGVFEMKTNNGLVTSSVELKNGIRNGKETVKSIDGLLISQGTYVNEKLHGPIKRYFPNGKLVFEGNYYSGKLHGDANYYDTAGSLRVKTSYAFGKEYGKSTTYYADQKLLSEVEMLDDKYHGELTFYNLQGKPVGAIGYVLDEVMYYRTLDNQGNLGEKQNVTENFVVESKYANGKTAFKFSFVKKLRDGKLEIYSENGQLNHLSTYVKNKLNGERIQHYENGQVYKRENFIKGNFYGTQEYFADNGDKLYSAEYISDDFHGDFKIYEKGKLVKTKKYDSDELAAIE